MISSTVENSTTFLLCIENKPGHARSVPMFSFFFFRRGLHRYARLRCDASNGDPDLHLHTSLVGRNVRRYPCKHFTLHGQGVAVAQLLRLRHFAGYSTSADRRSLSGPSSVGILNPDRGHIWLDRHPSTSLSTIPP